MTSSPIICSARTAAHVARLKERGLPQTVLILGPESVGKTALAREFVAGMPGAQLSPLVAGEDPKTGTPRAAIPVETIRELRSLFAISHGTPLVFIIERAQELYGASSNALLKIMEEPNANLHFIILARSLDTVLPTIQSRAAHLLMTPVSGALLAVGLRARGIEEALVGPAVLFAEGAPGRAIKFCEDATFRARVQSEHARFVSLLKTRKMADAELLLADLFGKKDRHVEARAEIAEMLGWWLAWLRRDTPQHKVIAKIAETIPLLFENMHPRLLMERIVIELHS